MQNVIRKAQTIFGSAEGSVKGAHRMYMQTVVLYFCLWHVIWIFWHTKRLIEILFDAGSLYSEICVFVVGQLFSSPAELWIKGQIQQSFFFGLVDLILVPFCTNVSFRFVRSMILVRTIWKYSYKIFSKLEV